MQTYKRFRLILLVLIISVSLCGCIIIPLSEHYEFTAAEVTSIQFIDFRDPEITVGPELCEPVYTIPEGQKADFLADFSELEFSDTLVITIAAVDPSFSYGDWVVRINFTNGQYSFYSSAGYGETFDAAGECISTTHYSCEDEELEALISQYYEIPLFESKDPTV